ncbi:MAG: hypothetical protein R3240_14015 [Gammaproteobacteria bacterium]|nr:hypothetical protein [Gammaproteobacteria bacterium]
MADTEDAIKKDLELQWSDHFHMRDQTWKTLTNSILFFLGVIGIQFNVNEKFVLVAANFALVITAFIGWSVAHHHRDRQNEKFKIIQKYEEMLGLYSLKHDVLHNAKRGIIHTALFIEVMQLALCFIGITLILGVLLK